MIFRLQKLPPNKQNGRLLEAIFYIYINTNIKTNKYIYMIKKGGKVGEEEVTM